MKLIKEKIDNDVFMDVFISDKELDKLMNEEMLNVEFSIGNLNVFIGINIGDEYAAEEREISEYNF